MARQPKPWEERSERSRDRLARWGRRTFGWSEAETRRYVESGGSTSDAYGHRTRAGSSEIERVHRRQRYLLERYGPRSKKRDEPYLTAEDMRRARREKGDEWVTQRLEQLREDHRAWREGRNPHAGDDQYARNASEEHNPEYAVWYMYH